MGKISIAVLITCHNRNEKTLECLKFFYGAEKPKEFIFEIFLVDDGSTDGTGEAVNSLFPNVHIIQGDGNLYWNRGMHLAWQVASEYNYFDYFLWLNDDTNLLPNAIIDLLRFDNKESIIVGTTISHINSTITYGGHLNKQLLIPNGKPQLCDSFNGNFVLIPQKVFSQLGNLDKYYIHALGDIDYGKRAFKKGIDIILSPNISGYCGHEWENPKWSSLELTLIERVRLLYSPLSGCTPNQLFYFDSKFNGIAIAIFHIFTVHLRLLFPIIWRYKS